ncbi:FAD-binding and (Fe-S)-binding domain-containing protein [Actinomadura atramentaria]|uniref:FAD-binding and (Fe-S)-binding domain-containing protein n=1 Tax=Actinomadura atramentaria TaxID=1990 RepID=UPI0003693C45|nr:FAD-binding and (Fe-S)-binding domain-containing protein [Actinomadura atramentaria]
METLERALRARVDGEVRFDAGSRAMYAHDASNYRWPPVGVVVPRTVDAGAEAVAVCREQGVPVLSRGGGTSLAGQCCNTAVVLDWSKYCTRLVELDQEANTAIVEPGACLDDLNAALEPHGLTVGPRPSTHATCTIGGMIGNDSCGATAQAYGRMTASVLRLEILTYDGVRTWVGPTDDAEYARVLGEGGRRAEIYRDLRELRDDGMALLRTRYPNIPRRVSGYSLDELLPEKGFNVARALVGSEGTLVTVLRAEIRVFERPAARTLVVLGYDDIATAADAVPAVAEHEPLALEGLDNELVELARADHLMSTDVRHQLPKGSGWLMVRFGGKSQDEADRRADDLLKALALSDHSPRVQYQDDPGSEEKLWKVREAGLGATAYPPGEPDTHEGWEDAAVPPDRLGDYLRDFRKLVDGFGYAPVSLYGHFGQGCVHTRIPFDLSDDAGVAKYRDFVRRAAQLVVDHGGSLSGEHGDGQSRAELLPLMFGDDMVDLFGRFKAVFDPDDRMNPGKVSTPGRKSKPEGITQNLDRRGYHPAEPATHFDYPHDHHRFAHAAERCVGIGNCRTSSGGVMCPSYRVTGEEKHATRGRARLLNEMMRGEVIRDGWRSDDVADALDLCLACKGCKQDCPVGVDMATYKAEFLSHHYAGRVRPAAHYAMGWLPLWAGLAAAAPRAANTLAHAPGLARLVKAAGGVDRRRDLPHFARRRFADWFRDREPAGTGWRGPVVLWPDTFTDNFHPESGKAAVEVLEKAGFRVESPPQPSPLGTATSGLCCGLTWISTGQLDVADRVLRRTARALAPRLRAGEEIVVLEPSCAAVFRSDAPDLISDGEEAETIRLLRDRTKTLAELLNAHDVPVSGGEKIKALAQPHCHHHAIMGFDADRELLARAGVDADVLDVGCCGLAGNFGFERGHYDVSVGAAELGLWPAVRGADPGTEVLADGFSCRTQIEAGTDAAPRHLAELLRELM